jgi:hypothetical protein
MSGWGGIAAIVVAIVAICALIAAVVLKGGVQTTAPSIVALIGFLSLLITGLLTAISVQSIGARLNGHLQQHMVTVEAATTANAAATAAASLLEQNSTVLSANTAILERIHRDTNSKLIDTEAEVRQLREQVAGQSQALALALAEIHAHNAEPPVSHVERGDDS